MLIQKKFKEDSSYIRGYIYFYSVSFNVFSIFICSARIFNFKQSTTGMRPRLQSLLCAEKIFSAHCWMCPRKIYRMHTVRAIFCRKTFKMQNVENNTLTTLNHFGDVLLQSLNVNRSNVIF